MKCDRMRKQKYKGRMKTTMLIMTYSLLIVCFELGCASLQPKAGNTDLTKNEQVLEIKIMDDLRQSPHVAGHAITVSVKDGNVQLSGLVESRLQVEQAEIIARNQLGVETVKNDIRIR